MPVTQTEKFTGFIITLLCCRLSILAHKSFQVEVAYTLGCVVLSHQENQEKLREEPGFRFDVLLDLLQSPDKVHVISWLHSAKVCLYLLKWNMRRHLSI